MRKLTAITFALLITTSAFAAPNDSSERRTPGVITRIVRQIKSIIRALDDIQPGVPVPSAYR
ncbi:MAG TPA: hypothetical protein VJZ76_03605 [Thermoanaerobaculia bacterium]|nr:hypothetical protein [Thermoanaerobaculia bacterium]